MEAAEVMGLVVGEMVVVLEAVLEVDSVEVAMDLVEAGTDLEVGVVVETAVETVVETAAEKVDRTVPCSFHRIDCCHIHFLRCNRQRVRMPIDT